MNHRLDAAHSTGPKVGYVVKRYPRFSETFIVNEILAHEAAGMQLEIFSLRPSVDTHFQNVISQVRAPVNYLPGGSVKSGTLWRQCHKLARRFPRLWDALAAAKHADVVEAYQAVELAALIREKGIEHLHAHFATSAASVAQIAAAITGITWSVTMHAKDIFHESVVREDLQSKIDAADAVVTVSDFNLQFLTSQFGNHSKIHRVYNGLDLSVFDYHKSSVSTRKIISVGRLVEKKGLRYLVDACAILSDRGIEYDCDIVGTGELEQPLREQILQLAVDDRVRLIGPQPQNVVREMIRTADAFVAPCVVGEDGNRDGLPTVITESLALGTPCISTDVTGIPEIIRPGETGVIVAQQSPEELANEIQKIFDDEALRKSYSISGRRLVEAEFDIHQNAATIRKLFGRGATDKQPSDGFVEASRVGVSS